MIYTWFITENMLRLKFIVQLFCNLKNAYARRVVAPIGNSETIVYRRQQNKCLVGLWKNIHENRNVRVRRMLIRMVFECTECSSSWNLTSNLWRVNSEQIMSDSMVRIFVWQFVDGLNSLLHELSSGRQSLHLWLQMI